MNWDLFFTIMGSGTGGAVIIKFIEYYFLPKKDKKEFEKKINQYIREIDKCISFLSQ